MSGQPRFTQYLAGIIALLLLTATVSPANRASAPADSRPLSAEVSSLEIEMLQTINNIRTRAGLTPLQFDVRSLDMAEEQALDMAERGYFDHMRPGLPDRKSESFGERVRRFGFRGSVGENLGTSSGYSAQESLRVAVDGWMRSPGHRANILNPNYQFTGIAHYRWAERLSLRRGNRVQWHDNWVQTFFSPR